jgi:hypothetical protein
MRISPAILQNRDRKGAARDAEVLWKVVFYDNELLHKR